jgi:hypothetical protein
MNIRNLAVFSFVCTVVVATGSDVEAKRTAAQQRLYEKAWKECSSPSYAWGTYPHINYTGGWFRCVEPELYPRKNGHKRN